MILKSPAFLRMKVADFRQLQIKNHKYHAKRTAYGSKVFDSAGEANLAQEIDLLIKGKRLDHVELQKVFPLYGQNGTKICNHRVDFFVTIAGSSGQSQEVWEYKGFQTKDYKIKLKLFKDNYPHIPYLIVGNKERYYV